MPIRTRHRAFRAAVRDRPGAADLLADAAQAFGAEYGARPAAPVTVVIPAFNEAGSVGAVVRSVPARICGLDAEVLLIDDGSTDSTGHEARSSGALVCRLPVNLGQGQALRLGYRLARERGAAVIATVDADGQFDPGQLPTLVGPIVAGEADFINGSRRLGRTEATDPARHLGLVVFGALVTVLTRVRITDPANGLRAFRAEVTEEVPLRQPQYQTAELLIGAMARGFRVREMPVTVYARTGGASKKGGNFFYGCQFARVVLTTWWSARPAARRHRTRTPPARTART
jgi:glycosyltransferase involved in cell wall biosynthesis